MSGSPMKATNEQIIAAYKQTGSVWKAARLLGMAGQTVHERLHAIGYQLASATWTEEEEAELRSLAGHLTIGEIARRLGRPFNGVAAKLHRLGLATGATGRARIKVPRGAGYDKANIKRYIREIDATGDTVSRFARRNGLGVEGLCQALERHVPEWWQQYRRSHSDLAETTCEGCGGLFFPSNSVQRFCTRKCASTSRVDRDYFGGRRSEAIGIAEGICQLCRRSVSKGLSAHHVLGKENDPENLSLVALCQGCHKIVGMLATRLFVDDADAWADLISLVWLRRHGANPGHGAFVSVDIDPLAAEDVEQLDAATPTKADAVSHYGQLAEDAAALI